jgi:hypothetical protein
VTEVAAPATLEQGAELAATAVLASLQAVHRQYEAAAADRVVEALRIVRPDEDEDRLNEAADWLAATEIAAVNAVARARLGVDLQEAFVQPNPARRRRDVRRLLAEERSRLEQSVGVVLLEPAIEMLELVQTA